MDVVQRGAVGEEGSTPPIVAVFPWLDPTKPSEVVLWQLRPVGDTHLGVFIDATGSLVPAFLRARVAAAETKDKKIVDALSWAVMTDTEKRKFADSEGAKEGVGLFNTEAHSATPLPQWDAEGMKLPPQALKWSIRRANAHH